MMVYSRWDYIHEVTSKLYPTIAERYNTTSVRVERNLRHCIELFFEKGDMYVLKEIFPNYPRRKKYTSKETIACMVEYLKNGNNFKDSFFDSEAFDAIMEYMEK